MMTEPCIAASPGARVSVRVGSAQQISCRVLSPRNARRGAPGRSQAGGLKRHRAVPVRAQRGRCPLADAALSGQPEVERLVLLGEQHGDHPVEPGRLGAEDGERDPGRLLARKGVGAGGDGREGDGPDARFGPGRLERGEIGLTKQRALAPIAPVPHRPHRVHHEARQEPEAGSEHRVSGGTPANPAASGEELRPRGAVNCTVDATAAEERGVRRVDDGIHVERGDVATDDLHHSRSAWRAHLARCSTLRRGRKDAREAGMSAILLALGSALGYGGSDFVAGWLSRKSDYARVGLLSQLTAATGCVVVAAMVGGPTSAASLRWGALAGLGGGFGTLALYRGLGRGRMNVVAPLSGVLAAGLPALVGLALGERPSAAAMVGLLLALPAVWLTSSVDAAPGIPQAASVRSSIVDGVLAGVGFAVLFVGLQRGGRGAGLWPSAVSQVVSVFPMIALYLWRLRGPGEAAPGTAWIRFGPILGGVFAA